jgi:hypothetical protein
MVERPGNRIRWGEARNRTNQKGPDGTERNRKETEGTEGTDLNPSREKKGTQGTGFELHGKIRFPKKADEGLKDALKSFKRQALHAKKLTISHPITGEEMSWKAPLPQDLQDLLAVLNKFDPV